MKRVDHSAMKLGCLPAKHSNGTLRLARYLPSTQIKIPDTLDNLEKVENWGLMLNDKLGDCTIAGIGHSIQLWTTLAQGAAVVVPDDEIKRVYFEITGGQDSGCVEEDVLTYMRTKGLGGHKIANFALIESHNHYLRRLAMFLFGLTYKGVSLPLSAQSQDIWTLTHGHDAIPGSWGGHCIIDGAYDENFYTAVTWGVQKKQTIAWDDRYCSEAYALLSPDWVEVGRTIAPNGLEWNMLEDDLAEVG